MFHYNLKLDLALNPLNFIGVSQNIERTLSLIINNSKIDY